MAFDGFSISCDLPCRSASDRDNSVLLEAWITLPLIWARASPGLADSSLSHGKGFLLASAGLVAINCPLQLLRHSPAYCLHTKDLQNWKCGCTSHFLCILRNNVETFSHHLHVQKGYLAFSCLVPAFTCGVRDL